MKKLFGILFIVMLVSCNDSGHDNDKIVSEDQHQKHDGNKILELNSGVKWQADSSTNNNVSNLQTVIQKFYDNNNISLPAYKTAAAQLQLGLDKMVRECKMKGPEHDALHLWLVPLMQEVKNLSKAVTAEEATQTFAAVDQQVNRYNQFFK